jgi:hypothetical protein
VLPQPSATEEGPQQALARQGLAHQTDDELMRIGRKIKQLTADILSLRDRRAELCLRSAAEGEVQNTRVGAIANQQEAPTRRGSKRGASMVGAATAS